jgi:hypothetical protein
MSRISTKIWRTIGWISVAFVVLSVPLSLIDGVIAAFALYAAIVIGGLSSVGLKSTAKFGIATIAVSLLLGMIATHYTSSTGFRPPELALVWAAISIFAIPILASVALMIAGVLRRRHAERLTLAG